MNTVEYRQQVQDTVRIAFLARLETYLALVDESKSSEDHRKAVELLAKLGDVMPEKDQAKTLPVVHINFGGGSVTVTPMVEEVDQAAQALEMEMVEPVSVSPELAPTPLMKQSLGVNLDVESLLVDAAA